ncbi:MAG TPA: alpha/beta hydrolase [Mucilaginibacter sp.]
MNSTVEIQIEKKQGYAPINGLNMYYKIQGSGKPLVYIPPVFGYSGVTEFPTLIEKYQLITMDLQGNGRTADIERPLSFEQQATDIVALLHYLEIKKADFLGECVGGITTMIIAIRYPELVGRIATYGTVFSPFREAYKPEMLGIRLGGAPDAPGIQFQRENYKKVAPDPEYWSTIWSKTLSLSFTGFTNEELTSLKAPVLIAVGDHDFVRLEHMVQTFQLIPNAELAVIPDAGHFVLNAEQYKAMPPIEAFLDKSLTELPFATTESGYHPEETR